MLLRAFSAPPRRSCQLASAAEWTLPNSTGSAVPPVYSGSSTTSGKPAKGGVFAGGFGLGFSAGFSAGSSAGLSASSSGCVSPVVGFSEPGLSVFGSSEGGALPSGLTEAAIGSFGSSAGFSASAATAAGLGGCASPDWPSAAGVASRVVGSNFKSGAPILGKSLSSSLAATGVGDASGAVSAVPAPAAAATSSSGGRLPDEVKNTTSPTIKAIPSAIPAPENSTTFGRCW